MMDADQNPSVLLAAAATSLAKSDFRLLVSEMREQNFDTIRFATYRTACKLRFVQKKVNLHLVDIWNVIESFRENGLSALEYRTEVKASRVELLLSTIYHNLNKRLPVSQQIDSDLTIRLLNSFLVAAYDREDSGKFQIFSVKVALATLCAGKLLDKLRYIFSLISNGSAVLDYGRFCDYLREVLALPCAVFEGPTFSYSENSPKQFFDSGSKITVSVFLDALMADPCLPCLMWLPLFHRMASVEHVFHPVVCDACGRDSFTGFRYRCQRCHSYQLCQDCFWRGRVSGSHTNQHEMKEYSSYKSPTKQLSHSISKSFQCVPGQASRKLVVPDAPERPLDLSNVVPSSPSLVRGHFKRSPDLDMVDGMAVDANACLTKYPAGVAIACKILPFSSPNFDDSLDDEHKLIARYTAKLSGRSTYHPVMINAYEDNFEHKATIAHLEKKNREILREINRLQAMQSATSLSALSASGNAENGISAELDNLRLRKAELEMRMQQLQDTRKDLLVQLEGLMKVLKTQSGRESSPRSVQSLNGNETKGRDVSSLSDSDKPCSPYGTQSRSAGGQTSSPYSTCGIRKTSLQTDLLSAADSITNTMTSLVQELNPDLEQEEPQQQQQAQPSDSVACNENGS